MDGLLDNTYRDDIEVDQDVLIVLKKDQRSGKLTKGVVKKILSPGSVHTRGIKVRLTSGQVGRVQRILTNND
ncbi:MAG: YwbE family protein [Epsilonproteobacteria bacterium]|nr:MAG: YwbE family protein [Campylobacterota bacterium]